MREVFKQRIPVKAKLERPSAHHSLRMKRMAKLLAAGAGIVLILMITGIGGILADRLVFYARVAKLYTQAPDSRIAMPLKDVSRKRIANTWHAPRGIGRLHEGQDIFAPKGTPILSATTGYVYKIGENNLGGQTVSVIGAGGRVYYYAHLDSYAPRLAVGDRVTTRTVLGFVGTTGNAQGTPPHLHFGVYTPTGAIDPLPLLSDRTAPVLTRTKPTESRATRRMVSRRA
jgi:peptidoglycan LD-endopeptidase LytH